MNSNELERIYRYHQRRQRPYQAVYDQWKEILESGESPNEEWNISNDPRRASPLFSAVLDGSLQLTELLLGCKARLNEHNGEGRTVLQEAVILAHERIILLLLNEGADIGSQMLSGFLCGGTALHLAVTEGLVDVVRSLLSHGANAQARTEIGWTPVDIAVLDHQATVLELFLTRIGLSTVAGQALDIVVSAYENVKDHHDQTAIASHLLEHGVRDTEGRHVSFFQRSLSETIKKLDSSRANMQELSTVLIRNMEALLRSDAGVSKETAWPRNLCEACERFENQDSYNIYKVYEHKQDFSTLTSSSDEGCNLCNFFMESLKSHWCLLHQLEEKWLKEFGVMPRVRLRIETVPRSVLGEHRLIIVCGEKIAFRDLDHVQKRINTAIAETGPSDTEGTASERSLAVAKAWLERCDDEHPSCRRFELGRLPRRVINVGSESSNPYIYVSARERVPYATLSYCWGQDHNARLLSENINAYTQRLPSAVLPQTIADAILVVQRMDVKYLWVDSLCILQDSEADMEEELAYMGDIYANAWFTIAAKASPTCTSGLFQQRHWPTSAIVPTEIRLPSRTMQQEGGIHGRVMNTRTSCTNRLMALPRHHKPSDDDQIPILDTRGWALQEELLSRRMLNFGKNELSWTCLEGSCTERVPEESDTRGHHKFQPVVKRALVTGFANYGNFNRVGKDEIFNYWLEAVEDFLRRKLSQPRDRLAAIVGVQGVIGKLLDDDPIAGIWKGHFFAPSLLWRIKHKSEDVEIYSFHSPSWSWASTSQPVEYVKHPSCTDNSRPWTWHHEVKYYSEAVSWTIDDRGLHGIDGSVTVRCKLLREADLDAYCERYVVADFLNKPPRSKSGKEAIHFQTYHDFEDDAAISDSWLMLLRTNQFIPGAKDQGYKYDIETYLLRLEKISPLREDFRRVGLVLTRSWANKWLEHATEETVRLF